MAADKDSKGLVKMDDLEVLRTELCYVTSIHKPTRTFFAQFCKFTNEELTSFNETINNYCCKVITERTKNGRPDTGVPKSIHKGDILCAKFTRHDEQPWYRARVLSRDKAHQKCSVVFVDYGGVETDVPMSNLIQATVADLPIMQRAPFGVACFVTDSEKMSPNDADHLLNCLAENYLMIKVMERQSSLQWRVEIPRHAYNTPFWLTYDKAAPETTEATQETAKDGEQTCGLASTAAT